MTNPAPGTRCDLRSLSGVELDPSAEGLLASARTCCFGSRAWQNRKLAEATDLLRLARLSRRMLILNLDLAVELRAELLLRVTVPCLPDPGGSLLVMDTARLGVTYREEAMLIPQPGYSFVQILAPRQVWLANVDTDHQVLCLGPQLPAGILVNEIILLSYMALSMVATQFDPGDPAGVLNLDAARWWQQQRSVALPLSLEPFLCPEEPIP